MAEPILHLKNIHKRFGPVHALKGVDLVVYPGEVHALIGENGAGKSTLMKVLSGAHQATEGEIILEGHAYKPLTPHAGRESGVAMIYQELTLAPQLTVEENITLGVEKSSFGFVKHENKKVREALDLLGQHGVSPNTKVEELNIGTRQLIEIARAMVAEAKVIIMDEPTSSLSREDTENLFRVMKTLRDSGIAIIYISHFLEEVKEISDRYTILRDGNTCGTGMLEDVSVEQIAEMLVGRSLDNMYPHVEHEIGETVLSVKNLNGREFPKDVSFELRKGEIMGIFGLVGAGRSETLRCIFGLDELVSGEITLNDGSLHNKGGITPKKSLNNNLDLLSEDRKTEGLAQGLSIAVNTTLSALYKESSKGFINLSKEKSLSDEWAKKLRTKCHSTLDAISTLSGGNQQKVAIARILNHDSDILFFDEPTRGIDVGSKAEIYQLIQEMAAQGKSIIVVSSYLPELEGVCDTLAVMYRGLISPSQPLSDWSKHKIMMFGTTGQMS
ncbi:MAG: sugar ABC transporter ATP-binding protein [Lentisphaeraceae bacterium]|nr:sugar ABC transporter ATP-binding protein [Lentisphaeraceae bacterium]